MKREIQPAFVHERLTIHLNKVIVLDTSEPTNISHKVEHPDR